MATAKWILRKMALAGLLAIAGSAAHAQVEFQATLWASGKELSQTAKDEAKRDGFPTLDHYSNWGERCLDPVEREVCLPAGCELDSSRSYTSESRPFYVERGFGQGGPGYGVVLQQVNSSASGWATHKLKLNPANKQWCLTSTVRICARRFQTGGHYKGYHEIYGRCRSLQPWTKSQPAGPFPLFPPHYRKLAEFSLPPGSGNGVPGTATTEKWWVTIDWKNPQFAPLQTGMFSGHPDASGANGRYFWARNTNDNDLFIRGLEVTQGIQNLSNQMPLVARRQTVVRGHLASQINVGGVHAWLRGYRDGSGLPGSPLAPETEIPGQSTGGDRLKIHDSFFFKLPPEWTEGMVTLQLEVDPDDLVPEKDEGNNVWEEIVQFAKPVPIKVTSVPLHLHPGGDSSKPALVYRDTHASFWPILRNLLRLHPVSSLMYWDCGIDVQTPAFHFLGREWDLTGGLDQALLLTRVGLVRAFNSCGDPDMHWVGLVHPDIDTDSTLGIAMLFGRSSWVKMESQTGPSWAVDGGATLAHELGHNRGLLHVRCSGSEMMNTPFYPYPYPDCRLAKGLDGYYGLDVHHQRWALAEPTVISNDPAAPPPHRAFPLMGYRSPSWSDPYSYCRLLALSGIHCDAGLIAGVFPASREAGVLASLSGTGIRVAASAAAPPPQEAPNLPPPVRDYLVVGGAIDLGTNEVAGLDVLQVTDPPANARQRQESDLSEIDELEPELDLVQLGGGGVIDLHTFQLRSADGPPDIHSFLEVVPLKRGAIGIQIRRNGQVLAERLASANAPWVRISSPNAGGSLLPGTIVSWQAEDPDGDALKYSVFYSPDGGQTWRVLAMELAATHYQLPSQLPRSSQALLRVMAHDGFWTTADHTDNELQVAGSPPRAIILQESGAAYPLGRTVTFAAIATDLDEGPITDPGRFAWTSDRDGGLGTGQEIATRGLSKGVHRITLTVTDDEGKQGRAAVLLFVGIDPSEGGWTAWLNADQPGGVGDFELLTNFVRQGVCPKPLAIECRTTSGRDWVATGQVYSCSSERGGVCVNQGQRCQDYEVRFFCPGARP